MKSEMQSAHSKLVRLLESHERTAGLHVRIHGDHLILGRAEVVGPDKKLENDDRVRLTRLSRSSYGLSVKRHTGRWERTPFVGTMEEMGDTILGVMQHLIASY